MRISSILCIGNLICDGVLLGLCVMMFYVDMQLYIDVVVEQIFVYFHCEKFVSCIILFRTSMFPFDEPLRKKCCKSYE